MAVFTIDFDVFLTIANVFSNGFIRFKFPSNLVEITNFQIGTQFYGTLVWLNMSQQNFQ